MHKLQEHKHVIHVAGTNGKGSTLAMLESLLLAQGDSVFFTSSPHLIKYNERFRYNRHDVKDSLLYEGLEVIRKIIGDTNKDATFIGTKYQYSFFEISIALAFWLAHKTKAKWLLLETGVGGRWDATNVVPSPALTAITPISFDHQSYLGNTLETIAVEKLAIHRKDTPLLIARQDKSLDAFLDRYISIHELTAYRAGKDFHLDTTNWKFHFPAYQIKDLEVSKPNLAGKMQAINLELALACYCTLYEKKELINEQARKQALQEIKWQGRLEYVLPNLLLDGAHNVAGMQSLIDHLKMFHVKHSILFAVSWLERKDIWSCNYDWGDLQIQFAPVLLDSKEAVQKETLCASLEKLPFSFDEPKKTKTFIQEWKEAKHKQYDLLVVAGSLYLLGEWKQQW